MNCRPGTLTRRIIARWGTGPTTVAEVRDLRTVAGGRHPGRGMAVALLSVMRDAS